MMELPLAVQITRPSPAHELLNRLVLACLAGVAALLVQALASPPRTVHICYETKHDIARATVKKYALEAFPSWLAAHHDLPCPPTLDALNEWMNNKDSRDPWGTDYVMLCGCALSVGAKGLAVSSAGEDRRFGTEDDIESWR